MILKIVIGDTMFVVVDEAFISIFTDITILHIWWLTKKIFAVPSLQKGFFWMLTVFIHTLRYLFYFCGCRTEVQIDPFWLNVLCRVNALIERETS